MESRFLQAFMGGLVATLISVICMMILTAVRVYDAGPPEVLSEMFGTRLFTSWCLLFLWGWLWSFLYVYLFRRPMDKIVNPVVRGAVYGGGMLVVTGLLMYPIAYAVGAEMVPTAFGYTVMLLVGYLAYGIALALYVRPPVRSRRRAAR